MENLIPAFILERYENGETDGRFDAFTMFVDISGFTEITQSLVNKGKEGAEILSEIINRVFEAVIECVYRAGGFIANFAGDAFTAVFNINAIFAQRVLAAASEIHEIFSLNRQAVTRLGTYELQARIGLAYGEICWKIIKATKSSAYYFKGKAIEQCAKAQQNSSIGSITADLSFIGMDDKIISIPKENGFYELPALQIKKSSSIKINTFKQSETTSIKNNFIPSTLSKNMILGEFREVVSVFVSFRDGLTDDEINDLIMQLMIDCSEYGAYFNNIDFGDKGACAVIFFGVPRSSENNVERALDFMLKIQSEMIKISATYGMVYWGRVGSDIRACFTCLGSCVNLASRYLGNAELGEIRIDRNIFFYPDISRKFDIKYIGKNIYKGFNHPIGVYSLKSQNHNVNVFSYENSFVGRKAEITFINDFLLPLENKNFAGVCYVDGQAGIGKTRLIQEIKNSTTNEAPVNWFYLPCDEILKKSFNPIVSFLKSYFNYNEKSSQNDNLENFLSKMESLLYSCQDNQLKGEISKWFFLLAQLIKIDYNPQSIPFLEAKSMYDNTLFALKSLIKAECRRTPVILFMDDIQWLDNETRQFLQILVQNIENYPLAILCTGRPMDNGEFFDLQLECASARINLQPLERTASDNLVKNIVMPLKSVDNSILELVYAKSEGNPFYIEQISSYLKDNHQLTLANGNFNIPSSVSALILSRVDMLEQQLKETIKVAAVLGREFLTAILAKVLNRACGFDDFLTNSKIAEGLEMNIWSGINQLSYIFRHALTRDTVYEMQMKSELRKIHLTVAESIEEIYVIDLSPFYADLAVHYDKAEVEEKALFYYEKAAVCEEKVWHNRKALEFYQRIAELSVENVSKYCQTVLRIVELKTTLGEWIDALDLSSKIIELAKQFGLTLIRGKALILAGWLEKLLCHYENAISCYNQAEEIYKQAGDEQKLADVYDKKGNYYLDQADYKSAIANLEKALTIYDKHNLQQGVCAIYSGLGSVYLERRDYPSALNFYQRALEIYEKNNDLKGISSISCNIGIVLVNLGDYQKALECFLRDKAISEEMGDRFGLSITYTSLGNLYFSLGDFEKALFYYQEKLHISKELGNLKSVSIALGHSGSVLVIQKKFKQGIEALLAAEKIQQKLNLKYYLSETLKDLAEAYFEMQNYDVCQEYLNQALSVALEIEDEGDIFACRFLKLRLKLKQNIISYHTEITELENLYAAQSEPERQADILFELFKFFTYEKHEPSRAKEYALRSAELYRECYAKTPNYRYKDNLDTIQKSVDIIIHQ